MQHFTIPCKGDAVLTCYILNHRPSRNPDQSPRPGIVLVPGGGYHWVVDHEQECVALQFAAQGYHVFILNYTVNEDGTKPLHSLPLEELASAMALIRSHAEEWMLDPDKLAVAGFSAGGHLAGSLAVHWHRDWLKERTHLLPEQIRPNAVILSYPVITTGPYAHQGSIEHLLGIPQSDEELALYSLENQVSEHMPPVFLWHTMEDEFVPPQNSLLLVQACVTHNIPIEFHLFPHNQHGLSLATKETVWVPTSEDPHIAHWFSLCIEWLQELWA